LKVVDRRLVKGENLSRLCHIFTKFALRMCVMVLAKSLGCVVFGVVVWVGVLCWV